MSEMKTIKFPGDAEPRVIVDAAAIHYTEQALTSEQQAQSRENIGAISAEDAITKNLLKDTNWWLGFYYGNGLKATNYDACNFYTGSCDAVSVNPGDTFTVIYTIPSAQTNNKWFALNLFDANGGYVQRIADLLTTYEVVGSNAVYTAEYAVPDGVYALSVSARSFAKGGQNIPDADATNADVAILADMIFIGTVGALDGYLAPKVSDRDNGKVLTVYNGKWAARNTEDIYENSNIKAINHRGYNSVAPENTLSAFRLSKKMGFQYVECDVTFTKDRVPIIIHDTSVDRTSNGTGYLWDLTYEDVRALDFGSWKSADYVGEKVPSFEELIILCKQIGLHPYLHIGNESEYDAKRLASIVKRNGMHKNVTWISYYPAALSTIKTEDEYARLGLLLDNVGDDSIANATALKGDNNEVFIDIPYATVTADFAAQCATNNIPLEVWTINDSAALASIDPYVSGFTSDTLRANVTLYDRFG